MKIILQWQDNREERRTETEIPEGKDWQEVQEFLHQAVKKAYKYSNEPVPKGLDYLS